MNRFTQGLIRCFSAVCAILYGHAVLAGTQITDQDRLIAEQSKSLQNIPMTMPVNIHAAAGKEEALSVFNEIKNNQLNKMNLTAPSQISDKVLVFVSKSLGDKALKSIAETLAYTPRSVLVFRGFVDETKITEEMLDLQRFAAQFDPVASIAMAPNLFRQYNITSVPTIVSLDETGERELARVSGLSNPEWLENKVAALTEYRDFGVKGPVEGIIERDLIELMQERVAKIDWAEKKENAIKRYWTNQTFIGLPKATKPRTRQIDPSIVITQTMKTNEGKIIHPIGTRINPLKMQSFNQALVIFNPLDKSQLPLVDEELALLKTKYDRITLIATEFDSGKGWDSYTEITNRFDAPVFKLTKDVLTRFDLQKTPSIVTAEHFKFVVKELAEKNDEI